jgi:hypothetical protein
LIPPSVWIELKLVIVVTLTPAAVVITPLAESAPAPLIEKAHEFAQKALAVPEAVEEKPPVTVTPEKMGELVVEMP